MTFTLTLPGTDFRECYRELRSGRAKEPKLTDLPKAKSDLHELFRDDPLSGPLDIRFSVYDPSNRRMIVLACNKTPSPRRCNLTHLELKEDDKGWPVITSCESTTLSDGRIVVGFRGEDCYATFSDALLAIRQLRKYNVRHENLMRMFWGMAFPGTPFPRASGDPLLLKINNGALSELQYRALNPNHVVSCTIKNILSQPTYHIDLS